MSYLTDYEDIDGGYVAFGGNPKGRKIIGKGTIRTGKLDSKIMYLVRELKFNLFSVSQTCDKKNNVLFNDTKCIILSLNFKLIDESQVLLRVPRKNIMYSVDLKNIVPKGGLTCLFAKATSDESKLWHRRLGHLNFKTLNKLVKGNLVRGLPSKVFENVETCVACQMGKQHKASCKTKTENLISLPLHLLHMDLFGPTFVKSFMKKMYCLVVTDDYSRCPVTILNTLDHLGKFNSKTEEGFFVGYSINSKAFRVFNSRKKIVEENLHIRFSENTPNVVGSRPDWLFNIDALTRTMNYEPIAAGTLSNGFADDGFQPSSDSGKKVDKDPSIGSECIDQEQDDNVNNNNNANAASTNGVNDVSENICNELPFDPNMPALEDISTFNFSSDHEDDDEEANMNNMDTTIQVSPVPTTRIHKDHPFDQVIGDLQSTTQTRNMSKNLEEHGLSVAYASFKDFVVYQMDVKSAFLYGKIEEEVYVCQPPGFEDPDFPDKVYKVEKAIHGLHQAPRAWYETLSTYLLNNGFQRGKIDKTLFIRRYEGDILLIQVYVDDIIFGLTKKELCIAFEKMMHKKFQMSSMRELTFFLGLFIEVKNASTSMETQKSLLKDEDDKEVDVHMYRSMIGSLMYLTSSRPNIMFAVRACARYQVNLKVSHLHAVKTIFRYFKGQPKFGLWYLKDSSFDLVAYTDSDYAGASLDRKSTTKGCQFLGCRLISWQCTK
uniref:Putative ribonuclease H-like domain-containing protein n=1 Tax=Tanacetum cinerariifolium TaxID=118510 RepID=A0A6L2JWY3_TANCI|nr:putative ribonuclease H-like domain-containing protein [Tanacetum cinerariifolium]GEW73450.1 putative ribonuclease H-like domain-containing protein [Tanacetum cinerariifolium]